MLGGCFKMLIKPIWELSQSGKSLSQPWWGFSNRASPYILLYNKKLNQAIKAEKVDTAEVTNTEINVNNS